AEIVARVASVADGVAVAIGLVGVRDRRAVVERVADTVTVAVGRDLIVGTGGARSGAGFLGIAVTGRATADERARLEAVRRALPDRPVAGLRDVAVARRRAALEPGRQDDVGGAVIGGPVAALGDVAGADRRAADPRALLVRGAVVADAVTALRQIAGAGSGPADGGALRVGRANRIRARAALGEVARTRRGPALDGGRLDRVRRAARVAAGAELGDVAVARDRAALDAGGQDGVRRAVVADPVAALGHVTGSCRGPTDVRALGVGRAVSARAGAELWQVAVAARCTADDVRTVPIRRMDARAGGVAHVPGARILVVGAGGLRRLLSAHARAVL